MERDNFDWSVFGSAANLEFFKAKFGPDVFGRIVGFAVNDGQDLQIDSFWCHDKLNYVDKHYIAFPNKWKVMLKYAYMPIIRKAFDDAKEMDSIIWDVLAMGSEAVGQYVLDNYAKELYTMFSSYDNSLHLVMIESNAQMFVLLHRNGIFECGDIDFYWAYQSANNHLIEYLVSNDLVSISTIMHELHWDRYFHDEIHRKYCIHNCICEDRRSAITSEIVLPDECHSDIYILLRNLVRANYLRKKSSQ